MRRSVHQIIASVTVCAAALAARGHETDQYSVPTGREFADLGVYFSGAIHDVLERAVAKLNAQITRSSGGDNDAVSPETARYQSPRTVVRTVYHAMPLWLNWVEPLESRLLSARQRARFPGRVTVYQPPTWIYHHWALVLDPTKLPRLVRCGTVMVNGVYFGTDKLMHLTHVGYQYYEVYRRARAAGDDEAQATRAAVKLGTGSHPFLSEATWLGLMTTGVWSNADLAVNYVGLLFFRNLTEEIVVGGVPRPPMLVRDGAYWRLNDHVQPGVDLLSPFVTDHWDEVLNPNWYGPGMGSCVKTQVAKRCTQVAAWYRDRHLRPRTAADFSRVAQELATYYGADYGHRGDWADMVTYANVCLAPAGDADTAGALAADDAPDALGRGALWWAAADDDVARVRQLMDNGAPINAADIDGETPVHAAARAGAAEVIIALAGGGATVNVRAAYGVTPLHLAVRGNHADAARALLAAGAVAEITDDFGATPLCDAVARGRLDLTRILVAQGADPNRVDRSGRTARDHATRAGHQPIIDWLDNTVLTAE